MASAILRDMVEADYPFLYSSWLKSYKPSRSVGPLPSNLYWSVVKETIEQILARKGIICKVACNSEDPEQIFGYLVAEDNGALPVCHYLYVKQPFRRLGIARMLINAFLAERRTFKHTFKTRDCRHLPSSYCGIYSPDEVRRKPGERKDRETNPAMVSEKRPATQAGKKDYGRVNGDV